MRRIASIIAEPDSRNFPTESARKDLGIESVPDVSCLDVRREVLDQETRLDDEADFRRIDITLTTGHIRTDGIRFFAEPRLDVDDRTRPDHDDGITFVRTDDHVREVVHVHVDATAQ